MNILKLAARRNASSAQYAFVIISHKMQSRMFYVMLVCRAFKIIFVVNAEILAHLLQFAVLISYTAQTVFLMIGQNKLKIYFSGFLHCVRICEYFHAVGRGLNARGDHRPRAFHLDKAYPARAYRVYIFHVTKSGNVDRRGFARLKYRRIFRDAIFFAVYFYVYIFHNYITFLLILITALL